MPTVHGGLPDPGGLVGDPSRPASADLVDTERLHRLGLGRQHRPGVTGERRRNDPPGERIVAGRLDDRAALIGHRRPGRSP
ncbi:hypothetical protein ABZ402_23145 [Streptomyces mirabilis]|uniref:hypothetical protein n=1 Tax=Streptomyces mirabilis TaxID=68239 RepID=UPI0033E471CF